MCAHEINIDELYEYQLKDLIVSYAWVVPSRLLIS